MKSTISIALLSIICHLTMQAQELFVYTEPASNMPAKSIGARITHWVMNETHTQTLNYHAIPELMWGINKNLMVHVEGFFNNNNKNFSAKGAALYAKYRFFSKDEVYKHCRLATFCRLSTNNNQTHRQEIETNGYNTGVEIGAIGTQLLHKLALSSTISYEHAIYNTNKYTVPTNMPNSSAINYSLSVGRLILPKTYTSYKQTNINVMLELLGQSLLSSNKLYVDIAPSVQLIFNSQTRLDIGYKKELYSNMLRVSQNGVLVRIEHILFNVL